MAVYIRGRYLLWKVILPTTWVFMLMLMAMAQDYASRQRLTQDDVQAKQLRVTEDWSKNVIDAGDWKNGAANRVNTDDEKDKHIRKRPKNCRLYPDMLIIGFEKCGTMTLRHYLGTHPELYITKSNLSIPYFNTIGYMSLETFTRNMSCTPLGKLRLEKISTQGSAEKVYATLPNIPLIAIVREPVERAMSHHVHRIARQKETHENFDDAIKSTLDTGNVNFNIMSVLFRQSTYVDRLKQWIETYGRAKIHVVDGDNFIINPSSELQKVEKFLGISPYFSDQHFVYNPAKKFYCLKTSEKDTTGCMNSDKGRPHPEMTNATRKRLQEYFKPFNEKLFQILGQTFSWNY